MPAPPPAPDQPGSSHAESSHAELSDSELSYPEPSHAQPSHRTTVSCAWCGTTAERPSITWMYELDPRRGGVWYCERCSRDNLRSVEAKLDQEWW